MLHFVLPSSRIAVLVRIVENSLAFALSGFEVPIVASFAVGVGQLSDPLFEVTLESASVNITISVSVGPFAMSSLSRVSLNPSAPDLLLHGILHRSDLLQGTQQLLSL